MQRRSLQVLPGMFSSSSSSSSSPSRSSSNPLRDAAAVDGKDDVDDDDDDRLDGDRRSIEKKENEDFIEMTKNVKKIIENTTELSNRITTLKYELIQSKELTTVDLTKRITDETKILTNEIKTILSKISEEKTDVGSNNSNGMNDNGFVELKRRSAMIDSKHIERACADVVVSQLYPLIMTVFVQENNDMDTIACLKIDVLREEMTPKKAGIREIFWLGDGDAKSVARAYKDAIECLKVLPEMDNITKKFQCLRATFGLIEEKVREFYKGKGSEKKKAVLCSDDLISILSFVIVRSRLGDCKAEVDFMSKFIPDVLCIGEEGFMLTTFMSCVELLVRISSEDLD